MHAAKGLEFPVVFLVGCEDGLLPFRLPDGSTDEDEERRLLFVGMTRAERLLHLSWSRRRTVRGETVARTRSPFLDAIDSADLRTVASTHRPRRATASPDRQLSLL